MTTPTPLTAEQKQAALTAFSRAYGNSIASSTGCFGCAVQVVGIILVVWLLTHISEVNAALDRIVR
jgi:hypothetical protein